MFSGRTGLQNTSFALMDPSGKKVTRGSRSPSQLYETPEEFAAALTELASAYTKKAKPIEALPTVRDLRLALNVAAADMRPLVIVRGKDAREAKELARQASATAWSGEVVGTSHYVVLDKETDFEGLKPKLGVTVVQPDPYGQGGEVLSHAPPKTKPEKLSASIAKGLAEHAVKSREHQDHIREARRRGIAWESEIPVTDEQVRKRRR